MSWGKFVVGAVEYDLTHLDPFLMTVAPKDGSASYKVLVTFGHHSFTREWKATDTEDLKFANGAEVRCFCTDRHGCSGSLPGIISAAASGKAYFSQGRNFLLVENLPGLVEPYAVFFNMEPAKAKGVDVSMFVVSAYPKGGLPAKKNLLSITMATLVGKTVRGEKITKPPPKAKK